MYEQQSDILVSLNFNTLIQINEKVFSFTCFRL